MVRSADPRRASPGVATIARSAAVITKDFISAKDLCTYSIIILRQEKSFVIIGLTAAWCVDRVADESSAVDVTRRKNQATRPA
jgi:hypothetical protein